MRDIRRYEIQALTLALLVGAGLALLANHVNVHGLVGLAGKLVSLGLLHDLTGNEDLLDHTPGRRGDVVEHNANRHAPAEPHHHDGHDDAHDPRLRGHGGVGVLLVEQHGNEREDAEGKVKEDVEPRTGPTEAHDGVVGGGG